MTTIASSDDHWLKEGKELGAQLRLKLELAGCVKPTPIQQLKKTLKKCHINTNTEGFRYPFLIRLQSSIFIFALVSGCASAPKLDQIPNNETMSIVVTMSPTADGQIELKNAAVGEDTAKGARGGAMGGGALGAMCGFMAPVCIPLFATYGAAVGGGVGAATSTGGNLSTEQATQLRDRMLRLNESHDKLAELATNINDRAGRYWDLNSIEPQTTVRVGVQDLIFASTHEKQVRAILQVSVTVKKKSDKPLREEEVPVVKDYEYASPYASLDLWLDDENDFADTSISIAIRQISNQIVSDLAGSPITDETVQIAKLNAELVKQQGRELVEILGIYKSVVKSNKGRKTKSVVILAQSGNEIQGKFLPDSGDRITGTLQNNNIRFHWTFADSAYDRVGTWKIRDSRNDSLDGTWENEGNTTGTWKLSKIGPGKATDIDGLTFTASKNISQTAIVNLTGTYRSKITGNYREPDVVEIEQAGNKITGISANKEWEIEGVLEGDTIKFVWYGPSNKGKGKFILGSRGNLTGVYAGDSWGEGKWNLKKIE